MQNLFSYGRLTPEIVEKLKEILGENNVSLDEEKIETYSHDEVLACMYKRKYNADALIFPESTGQVSAVMKLASENRIPVTPRGAGTGLSGGEGRRMGLKKSAQVFLTKGADRPVRGIGTKADAETSSETSRAPRGPTPGAKPRGPARPPAPKGRR